MNSEQIKYEIQDRKSLLRVGLITELINNVCLLIMIYTNSINGTLKEAMPPILISLIINFGITLQNIKVNRSLKELNA